jgi:CDGSH-type Zn-finger protein/truncated hemoglobin YjbI
MPNVEAELQLLLAVVSDLEAELRGRPGSEQHLGAADRLRDSVVRPLRQVSETLGAARRTPAGGSLQSPADPANSGVLSPGLDDGPGDRVWSMAQTATELWARSPDLPELGEAVATLQDLAVTMADAASAAGRLAALTTLQAGQDQRIEVARNGPYLVTNPAALVDWLGLPLPVRPQMALCRCGASRSKPFCDGAHAQIGFIDAKDPSRVPDRRDTYVGQQVTISDNRGTCQHSGFCTDRLATVFRAAQDPFVAPSGGRMDEIIRAVRDCPSGALSYGIDGREARDEVDYHDQRHPVIEVSKDGPYRVTGGIPLADADGGEPARNDGSSREHYALCRCGHSQNKPFCSGMHWYVQFQDPEPGTGRELTIFEWAGGLPALTRMTRIFYEKYVPEDPLLAPLFATMSADHPQRVAKWLGEVFGGPKAYSGEYGGYTRMLSQHLGKCLTEEHRGRWVTLLLQSARDAGLPNDAEFRSAFGAYIEWGSRLAVENSQTDATPPAHMPMPHWDWHTAAGPPGSRISALAPAPAEQPAPELPPAGQPVGFEQHIKPLFRASDRQSMSFAFDLWSYDDVAQHAAAILNRLLAGTMPCDGAWPPERTDVFQRWTDTGKAP